jgi:ribosomal protein L37AE/L43A
MPIREDACNGPCNGRYRDGWQQYDQAMRTHGYAVDLYASAYQRHLADLSAWRPPLLYPLEPVAPVAPEPPTVPFSVADPVWCTRCRRMIFVALHRVNETAAVLNADITGFRGAAIVGPNGSKPLDPQAVIGTLDEVYGDLATVAANWQEVRGHPPLLPATRGSDARNTVVAYLLGELNTLLLHPASVEFGLNVLGWERRLLKLAKADPGRGRSVVRCPRCSERRLVREADGYYKCGSCRVLLNEAEHDREQGEQADEHDQQRQEARAS